MAGPAQLIQAISEATGVPLPTCVDIDRKLVKDGLRAKNGRGRNAARMTALDAARILTAMLGSAQASESAGAVHRYAETCAYPARSSESLFAQTEIADLAALPIRHSFVDGLAGLIASTTSGSVSALIKKQQENWRPHIEIFAFTQATYGRIRLSGLPSGMTANIEYLPLAKRPQGTSAASVGDLEQSRRITERTILSIAALLSGETEDDTAAGSGIRGGHAPRRR